MSAHLGQLTKDDKKRLNIKAAEIEHFITNHMFPINEDHLNGMVDYVVTKLFEFKESEPLKSD